MKNILNINGLAFIFMVFSATIAYAVDWVHIGTADGISFYVDYDRQRVDGPFWTAPITAESQKNTMRGEVVIDCRDKTAKLRLETYLQDWRPIVPGSPLSNVVRQVCR